MPRYGLGKAVFRMHDEPLWGVREGFGDADTRGAVVVAGAIVVGRLLNVGSGKGEGLGNVEPAGVAATVGWVDGSGDIGAVVDGGGDIGAVADGDGDIGVVVGDASGISGRTNEQERVRKKIQTIRKSKNCILKQMEETEDISVREQGRGLAKFTFFKT